VDDLKLSHEDPNIVMQVLETINNRYGKEVPITVMCGKVHDYLGMVLDYTEEGRVKISMNQYMNKILHELPADMTGEVPTSSKLTLTNRNEIQREKNGSMAMLQSFCS
jgi:hypothetical protein